MRMYSDTVKDVLVSSDKLYVHIEHVLVLIECSLAWIGSRP